MLALNVYKVPPIVISCVRSELTVYFFHGSTHMQIKFSTNAPCCPLSLLSGWTFPSSKPVTISSKTSSLSSAPNNISLLIFYS